MSAVVYADFRADNHRNGKARAVAPDLLALAYQTAIAALGGGKTLVVGIVRELRALLNAAELALGIGIYYGDD